MDCSVKLSIESCSAWVRDSRRPDSSTAAPDEAVIPAMIRRRLSTLSKIALSVALEGSLDQPVDYGVFCTRHGELPRTALLLGDLARADELSPTAFSQSVHNTAAGLFSIIRKEQAPTTSIAAGTDTFGYGLYEAYAYLNNNPGKKVLLVDFDEPVPDVFDVTPGNPASPYGVAFLLSDAEGLPCVQADSEVNSGIGHSLEPLALMFLRFWLSGESRGTAATERKLWRWGRDGTVA